MPETSLQQEQLQAQRTSQIVNGNGYVFTSHLTARQRINIAKLVGKKGFQLRPFGTQVHKYQSCQSWLSEDLSIKVDTLGTRGFFLARVGRNWPEADATSALPLEKTSGPESLDLLFSWNFDLSYPVPFQPITANVSSCDHMQRHVKI